MQFEALKKVCLFPLRTGSFEIVLLQGHAVYCIGVSMYGCVLWDFLYWDFNRVLRLNRLSFAVIKITGRKDTDAQL